MNGQYNLDLYICGFINCTAKNNGGAIFTTGGSLKAQKLCFYKSYIKQSTNNVFGNAIYINSATSAEYFSANLCGMSPSTASDSTFYFYEFKTEISYSNCSFCSGNGGPLGIGMDRISSQCNIKYLSIIGGDAAHAMCFWSDPSVIIDQISIINGHCSWQLWWISSSNINVNYAYMFGVTYDTFYSGSTLTFSNSYGDISFSTTGLSKTSYTTPSQIIIFYGDCQQGFFGVFTKHNIIKQSMISFAFYLVGIN